MEAEPTWTVADAREFDRRATADYGMPSLLLMENAGRGTVDALLARGVTGLVTICCGGGNNGGDGLVVARHLDGRGWACLVLLFADPAQLRGDAKINFEILRASGIPLTIVPPGDPMPDLATLFAASEWLVDALLGTGSRGEPRAPFDQVIAAMNQAGRSILAIDLPSGLDADSGVAAAATIRATLTCTYGAKKIGLTLPAAAAYVGEIEVVHLGTPRRLREDVSGV